MTTCARLLGFLLPLTLISSDLQAQEVLAREGRGRLERHPGGLVLHVAGTPYEMGYQHGKLLRDQVVRMTGLIYDSEKLADRKEYQLYKLLRGGMHERLRPFVPERFNEEMRGLADGSGLAFEVIEACNLFPEAFHCSGIALKGKATRDGSLYHVRILDYFTDLGLQDTALVIMHDPDEGNRWLNVGFAGFIGSVTGMNEQQITIGEMGGDGRFFWDGMPMAFLLRDALERASTLEQAVAIFRETPRTCEYYYVISDGKLRDARGIWATPEDFEVVEPGQSLGFVRVKRLRGEAAGNKAYLSSVQIDSDEHHLAFKGADGEVTGYVTMPPEDCVILSGLDRYGCFVDRLMPRYGEVDRDVLIEMIKRPVSMRSNLHCAIFHPETLQVWVAVAASDGSPACNQSYHCYTLEPQLPPEPGGQR